MACTQWFQLILASFGWYVIPTRHFPQKSLSRNSRIGFPFSSWPDHALLPLTYDPPLPILARYRLVVSGPYACSTSVYVQNLPTAHAFAMVMRLVCTFCPPSLTSYVVSCFLISHPFMVAPFGARLCLIVGFFSFSPFFCSFLQSCIACHTILIFLL